MKTPVMIEAYKQAAAGKFSLNDLMVIKNEFKSIVDSSLYSLNAADDSYPDIYQQIGTKASIHDLVYQMIINSRKAPATPKLIAGSCCRYGAAARRSEVSTRCDTMRLVCSVSTTCFRASPRRRRTSTR